MDVDAIRNSIKRGNIHKLLLKLWNDETLKLEVK
jgi:hypothetical protein